MAVELCLGSCDGPGDRLAGVWPDCGALSSSFYKSFPSLPFPAVFHADPELPHFLRSSVEL